VSTTYLELTPSLARALLDSIGCLSLGLSGNGRLSGSAHDRYDEQRINEMAWAIAEQDNPLADPEKRWSGTTTIEVDSSMRLLSGRRRCAAVVRAGRSIGARVVCREGG
jgi:hypothetical protein